MQEMIEKIQEYRDDVVKRCNDAIALLGNGTRAIAGTSTMIEVPRVKRRYTRRSTQHRAPSATRRKTVSAIKPVKCEFYNKCHMLVHPMGKRSHFRAHHPRAFSMRYGKGHKQAA
jgi:hypothetical protein